MSAVIHGAPRIDQQHGPGRDPRRAAAGERRRRRETPPARRSCRPSPRSSSAPRRDAPERDAPPQGPRPQGSPAPPPARSAAPARAAAVPSILSPVSQEQRAGHDPRRPRTAPQIRRNVSAIISAGGSRRQAAQKRPPEPGRKPAGRRGEDILMRAASLYESYIYTPPYPPIVQNAESRPGVPPWTASPRNHSGPPSRRSAARPKSAQIWKPRA